MARIKSNGGTINLYGTIRRQRFPDFNDNDVHLYIIMMCYNNTTSTIHIDIYNFVQLRKTF